MASAVTRQCCSLAGWPCWCLLCVTYTSGCHARPSITVTGTSRWARLKPGDSSGQAAASCCFLGDRYGHWDVLAWMAVLKRRSAVGALSWRHWPVYSLYFKCYINYGTLFGCPLDITRNTHLSSRPAGKNSIRLCLWSFNLLPKTFRI